MRSLPEIPTRMGARESTVKGKTTIAVNSRRRVSRSSLRVGVRRKLNSLPKRRGRYERKKRAEEKCVTIESAWNNIMEGKDSLFRKSNGKRKNIKASLVRSALVISP